MKSTIERDERLLALLRLNGRLTIDELATALLVGPATVRRDLRRLSGRGKIVRTYGGAAPAGPTFGETGATEIAEKRAIAAAATRLVEDGQTIVLSSGTTTLEFARRLIDRRLTVITNALDVANVLLDQPGIDLIILGGAVRPRMHSLLGHLTDLSAQELQADTLFMGIAAISIERGLLSDHMPEILTDRALRKMVRRLVVLADATKFDRVAPALVLPLNSVDVVVTDGSARPEILTALRASGVDVVVG